MSTATARIEDNPPGPSLGKAEDAIIAALTRRNKRIRWRVANTPVNPKPVIHRSPGT